MEAGLDLSEGKLAITDLTHGFCELLPVEPGPYRLRFCGPALGSLSFDALEGDDCYAVMLWPAPLAPEVVLKQFDPDAEEHG